MKIKYRTINDLGPYPKREIVTTPSITDPSCDESIEDVIRRASLGSTILGRNIYYDDTEDITQSDGFDLVDAGRIMQAQYSTATAPKPVPPTVKKPTETVISSGETK